MRYLSSEFRTPLVDEKGQVSGPWQKKMAAFNAPNFSDAEVPAGTVNGVNDTFTLAHVPNPPESLQFFWKLTAGEWILKSVTLTGNSAKLAVAPANGAGIAWYRW